jgi:hypothetical protein
MTTEFETEFEIDSKRERGVVLTGIYAHWCNAWDGLTMDETCLEFPCECYRDTVYWVEAIDRNDPFI